jgi:hypothetical protein
LASVVVRRRNILPFRRLRPERKTDRSERSEFDWSRTVESCDRQTRDRASLTSSITSLARNRRDTGITLPPADFMAIEPRPGRRTESRLRSSAVQTISSVTSI